MVTAKTFLCRCEDITVDDAVEALESTCEGFEDLKRFLGVGTGPCQGKSCVMACMRLVANARDLPLGEVDLMTFRPPVRPVPLGVLAAEDA